MATLRSGCVYLVDRLRLMTDDVSQDTWTDEQLQDILDAHRRYVHREKLAWKLGRSGGTPIYTEAFSRWNWYEETSGGTARFFIEDTAGTVQGTALWSASYIAGHVTFAANQAGSARYLTGYSFDLHAAAADCWRDKSATTSAYYDYVAGGAKMSRGQWFQHCMAMVEMHNALREPLTVEMFTDDDY